MSDMQLWPWTRAVSENRSRNEVLDILIPKILGILWERGEPSRIGVRALIDGDVTVGGFAVHERGFALHVYAPTRSRACEKVFSAHVGDPSVIDPTYFPYWQGRCGILNWKRGRWEDWIYVQSAAPRGLAQALTRGLAAIPRH
jgi:hypothetical protein